MTIEQAVWLVGGVMALCVIDVTACLLNRDCGGPTIRSVRRAISHVIAEMHRHKECDQEP